MRSDATQVHIKEDLRYCPLCYRCWRTYNAGYDAVDKGLTHFNGIPAYGKVKEICGECENDDNTN